MRCCLLLALGLGNIGIHRAMIAVTSGGGTEATYQFSGSDGEHLANLTASDSAVVASTDVMTGRGNSLDDLADLVTVFGASLARLSNLLSALNATVISQSATIAELTRKMDHFPTFPGNAFAAPRATSGSIIFYHQKQGTLPCFPGSEQLTFAECEHLAGGQYAGSWPHVREWHPSVNQPTWAPSWLRSAQQR